MRIDNDVLTIENKKLEKIKDNLINKKKCTCNVGLERYNTVLEQQKTDAEKLRNRFNGLFKELSEYRKKNVELNKELKKIQEESAVLYKQNNIADSSLTTVDKARKTLEEHIFKKINSNNENNKEFNSDQESKDLEEDSENNNQNSSFDSLEVKMKKKYKFEFRRL